MELIHGDSIEVLRGFDENSIDAVVTDPPYGLSFMGKRWDYDVPSVDLWREVYRVLKPGGHLLSFAGTRTQHRMAVNIEDAGFDIRDMIAWVYGSGFPKSLDVSKAIDKAAGVNREDKFEGVFGRRSGPTGNKRCEQCGKWLVSGSPCKCPRPQDDAVTEAARRWQGWGTALKPALEPITVARKPFKGTVANNVLEWGTGAINVDGCRVGDEVLPSVMAGQAKIGTFERGVMVTPERVGRWPANLIHDGDQAVLDLFPQSKGQQGDVRGTDPSRTGGDGTNCYGEFDRQPSAKRGDTGSAARFFYCAKASKRDRDEGLDALDDRVLARSCQAQAEAARGNTVDSASGSFNKARVRKNNHPTVKPTDLMRYLCRLVTPPGGTVLDPFMGSGSTGKAAVLEGFRFVGIEREAEYVEIADARIRGAI